jgi:hypothetical protein
MGTLFNHHSLFIFPKTQEEGIMGFNRQGKQSEKGAYKNG